MFLKFIFENPRLFFQLLNFFSVSYVEIPHHLLFCVHVVRKVVPGLRGSGGTVTPFSISNIACLNIIECSVGLSTSVAGMIFARINWPTKSLIANCSVLFDNHLVTKSLQDMFIARVSVCTAQKSKVTRIIT